METIDGKGLAINATPARVVEHAVVGVADRPIALVVSGINYGENIGTIVTVSGTIGAALEAANTGIPSLAVSQEIAGVDYRDYNKSVDFTAAIFFTRKLAEILLREELVFDVDVIKLDIPISELLKQLVWSRAWIGCCIMNLKLKNAKQCLELRQR